MTSSQRALQGRRDGPPWGQSAKSILQKRSRKSSWHSSKMLVSSIKLIALSRSCAVGFGSKSDRRIAFLHTLRNGDRYIGLSKENKNNYLRIYLLMYP